MYWVKSRPRYSLLMVPRTPTAPSPISTHWTLALKQRGLSLAREEKGSEVVRSRKSNMKTEWVMVSRWTSESTFVLKTSNYSILYDNIPMWFNINVKFRIQQFTFSISTLFNIFTEKGLILDFARHIYIRTAKCRQYLHFLTP